MTGNLRNTIIAACFGVMLTACGGGSSGSTPDPNPTGNSGELVVITMDNAQLTAGVVAGVALGDGVFGALSGLELPTIPGVVGAIGTGAAKITNSSQMLATSSAMVDCAAFGTVDIDVTVANPLQPTEGDIYALQFAQCDDGTGVVMHGGMIMTITGLDGDFESGGFLLGVRTELSAFQVTEAGETTGANGTVTVAIDSRTPPLTTITVSTSALATSSEGTAEAVTDLTLTISEDQSAFPTAVSVETSFTIDSPRIGGEVRVSTSLTLQASGDEYPYVGELRVSGAGNSAIVIIALDANRVRLEIDIDGDGAFDETLETTWDELMALTG